MSTQQMKSLDPNARLNFLERFAYGLGDYAGNLVYSAISAFLLVYYTDVLGVAAATAGSVMAISKIFDGVSDLVMGRIVDNTKSKWGKARPWIIRMSIPLAVCTVLMFSVPGSLTGASSITGSRDFRYLGTEDIRVQRQILRQNGAVVEASLKTKNSYRNIAIGTDTVELLRQMKRRSTSEYVFPSPTGGPISPDSVLHKLQRVLKRAGLEKLPFHALRHTFSVLALQNGVDIKTLSSMLGHYSAGFTLDTYAHVTTAMQTKAANTVSSFLSGAIQ